MLAASRGPTPSGRDLQGAAPPTVCLLVGGASRRPDDLAAAVQASKVAAMATVATTPLSGVAAGSWRLRHQVDDGLCRCSARRQWRVPQRCDGCEALALTAAPDHGPPPKRPVVDEGLGRLGVGAALVRIEV